MPLRFGWSQNVIRANIREMVQAGHTRAQAVAAAEVIARNNKARAAAIVRNRTRTHASPEKGS